MTSEERKEIENNVAQAREKIAAAAVRAGKRPEDILLVAATKMNDAERVQAAVQAGIDVCGENRVQELLGKYEEHAYDGCPLHFIGTLQSNKVKYLIGKVSMIESVSSVKLAKVIDKEARKAGIVQDILLEINIGGEESKSGFSPDQVPSIAASMESYPHCRLRGLMAIPPISKNPGDNCRFFTEIQRISVDIRTKKYNNSSMEILSMGMTDDFEDAIACGSTMIRVGTAIFGARNYTK